MRSSAPASERFRTVQVRVEKPSLSAMRPPLSVRWRIVPRRSWSTSPSPLRKLAEAFLEAVERHRDADAFLGRLEHHEDGIAALRKRLDQAIVKHDLGHAAI